jgi:RNA-directed DNA polymerase
LLANMTLDGLETAIRAATRQRHDKVNFIRYADDFVVTAAQRETLEQRVKPVIASFLRERGLSLSEEKTKITHIQEGFDFLGQNLRKRRKKLLITPSRKAIAGIREKARDCIRQCRGVATEVLIRMLNPILRGWANYHRHVVAREAFYQVDRYVNDLLWRWMKRRHPKKSWSWRYRKYFPAAGKGSFSTWVRTRDGEPRLLAIRNLLQTGMDRHIKVKADANPYHPDWVKYFEKRRCFAWRSYPVGNGSHRATVGL